MIRIFKDIEMPKGGNGGYNLYKKNETYIGFVYRIDNQSRTINVDIGLYNVEKKYLIGIDLRVFVNSDKLILGNEEYDVVYDDIVSNIESDIWDWIYPIKFLDSTLVEYINEK